MKSIVSVELVLVNHYPRTASLPVIHWRGLAWDQYDRAIVCNDLETQSRERSSTFSADTRKVDRASALVTLNAEADIDVSL